MITRILLAALAAAFVVTMEPAPAAAQGSTPSTTQTQKPTRTPRAARTPTPGQMSARQRMRECGKEWRDLKKAGKVEKGMRWPKYWSDCNKRLKAKGA